MLSRCEPNLSKHTITKSEDTLLSSVFLTSAHHGATLAIDAIDPVGTLDKRFYARLGIVFEKTMPYEKYVAGNMIEDAGIYYSLRSKFNAHNEPYSNHNGCVNSMKLIVENHICCGVTGGYHEISQYPDLLAPCLTEEDKYDYQRLIKYVRDGGQLYLSGGDCSGLLQEFFGAKISGRTREKVVYLAPNASPQAASVFGWFNEEYPLHFDGSAPIAEGIDKECVLATITLPYTTQDVVKFASIHSNPPGVKTDIPAMAAVRYGKGKVLWSALAIENIDKPYQYGEVFLNLLHTVFRLEQTVVSDAPKDVEIIAFREEQEMTISAVQLCEEAKARKVEPFTVRVKVPNHPQKVLRLYDETETAFAYENDMVTYTVEDLKLLDMRRIIF